MSELQRNRTEREVLLEPGSEPLTSLLELTEACLPTLTARLWATCCWSATMTGAWKLGDHNFLIAEVRPDPETSLYVQFWSEPLEPVEGEVCSGEWNPGAVKYLGRQQRDTLTSLGYSGGGRAGNYRKELQIRTSSEAEAVAREVLGIFFDVFGYRGQWPLEVKWHQGERAEHHPVYSAVTPEDLAKLADHVGFEVEAHGRREPVIHLRRGRRRLLVRLSGRVSGGCHYSMAEIETTLASPKPVDDGMVGRLNETLRFARVSRVDDQGLTLCLPLRFGGGVTARWMASSIQDFLSAWRACERLLKTARRVERVPTRGRRPGDPTVH